MIRDHKPLLVEGVGADEVLDGDARAVRARQPRVAHQRDSNLLQKMRYTELLYRFCFLARVAHQRRRYLCFVYAGPFRGSSLSRFNVVHSMGAHQRHRLRANKIEGADRVELELARGGVSDRADEEARRLDLPRLPRHLISTGDTLNLNEFRLLQSLHL